MRATAEVRVSSILGEDWARRRSVANEVLSLQVKDQYGRSLQTVSMPIIVKENSRSVLGLTPAYSMTA